MLYIGLLSEYIFTDISYRRLDTSTSNITPEYASLVTHPVVSLITKTVSND